MRARSLRATARCVAIGCLLLVAASSSRVEAIDTRHVVSSLGDPALEGRAVGSAGARLAAERIAGWFDAVGLKPGGDDGGWYQTFTPEEPGLDDAVRLPDGVEWGDFELRNVIGFAGGRGDQYVVVGAHYDHLGKDADGNVYPGADDNASGIAALLVAAQEIAGDPPHLRTVVFIAFSGEEVGVLGSRWYASHPIFPLDRTIAMLNLDTVGRMEANRLLVLSASSAKELGEMLQGINLQFRLDLQVPRQSPIGSDHTSFLERGIPALHFFTGANADYHRITDTVEKVNHDGIAQVAAFVAETARFLADRDRPLSFVLPEAAPTRGEEEAPASRAPRRVSLGSIPDMAFDGEGVLVSGVLPGSPAEKAGIRAGDRIVGLDQEAIRSLEDFSIALKARQPGDEVVVRFIRDGVEQGVAATLVERK